MCTECTTRRADSLSTACGVHYQTFLVFGRVDVPQFLDADTVVLRVVPTQVVFFLQLLAQLAAAAFREDGDGVQLHTGHVAVFLFAVVADTEIAGGDAFNGTVFVVEDFVGSKAWEDLDAKTFGLLTQPAAQVTQEIM